MAGQKVKAPWLTVKRLSRSHALLPRKESPRQNQISRPRPVPQNLRRPPTQSKVRTNLDKNPTVAKQFVLQPQDLRKTLLQQTNPFKPDFLLPEEF